ncbi:MAG TPA: oligosaccharide flippase family protein [Actinomycetota bacterium]
MSPEAAAGVVEQPQIDGGPTAHPELDVAEVRTLALRGVGAMLLRSIGQRGLQMVGNILLARWLAPETFGFYAIVSFIVGMAGFLSDLGLGASLVQRKEALQEKDLRTAFSLSFLLNVVVVGTLLAVAGPLIHAYDIDAGNVAAVQVLAATILFSTFVAVPAIRLERQLRFKELSIADVAGSLAYVFVAIPLAFQFKDPHVAQEGAASAVWVFVWATVASRVVYTIVLNLMSRWRPRFGLDVRAMRSMMSFGLPYQANGLVNALKDNFIPTFIAFALTAQSVGYVTWAVGLATNALFLLPIVSKVTFPAYARLQHDREALADAIEKSIKWVAATVFPATLFLAALARQIVEHVYGPKWFPGLTSFYLFCIPMLNAAYSTVAISALYGLGRAKTVLRLTMIWAAVGWALAVPLTLWIGMNGFAVAMSLVSCLSILAVSALRREIKIRILAPLVRILIIAAIPAALIGAVSHMVRDSFQLAGLAAAGGFAYLALLYLAGEMAEVRDLIGRLGFTRRKAVAAGASTIGTLILMLGLQVLHV